MKILVMGLPGSGKTTFAREIAYHFNLPHYNADTIREYYDDWDFSFVGRLKQASRMSSYQFGVLDFVCPSRDFRKLVNADYTIWLDTIQKSVHRDTNIVFEKPLEYNMRLYDYPNIKFLKYVLSQYDNSLKDIGNFLTYYRDVLDEYKYRHDND